MSNRYSFSKKNYGSATTALIISDEELGHIMGIVKSLKKSEILVKIISETIKNEAKEQKEGFLSMLLRTLAACVLGNALVIKGVRRAGEEVIREDQNLIF